MEERMNRTQRRVLAVERLAENDRERLRELNHRGDMFATALSIVEDSPVPNEGVQADVVEFLRAERDAAHAAADRLETALGLPHPW
jgi:hypothetical protein